MAFVLSIDLGRQLDAQRAMPHASSHRVIGEAPVPAPDLLQGTVDVLILRTLAWQPMHGYGISRWIRERSQDVLELEGAALYQALHRLERKRVILRPPGAFPRTIDARSTTSLPPKGAVGYAPKPPPGTSTPQP